MVEIAGDGTPEPVWRPYLERLAPPPFDPAGIERVVLVAPHPDDEVLACGGLLYELAAAGVPVRVVAVTDGEASHPGGPVPPAELARRRVAETTAALAHLGVPPADRLGRPDGGAAGLEEPVAALDPDGALLLGPWRGDGHPDHEAVGRGCARAAPDLVEYPIWMWHWATPGDPRVPWHRARRFPLSPAAQAAKARAVAEFRSQTTPPAVLPPAVLRRFARPYEIVFA